MKSQRNHNDVSADKPQPPAAVAVDIDARRTELTFDFFAPPRELRDMVYHYLWESAPRVAAYHYATNSGILAHYNGFILDEDHLDTWEKLQRTSRQTTVGDRTKMVACPRGYDPIRVSLKKAWLSSHAMPTGTFGQCAPGPSTMGMQPQPKPSWH
jgi:hypothetical protein